MLIGYIQNYYFHLREYWWWWILKHDELTLDKVTTRITRTERGTVAYWEA